MKIYILLLLVACASVWLFTPMIRRAAVRMGAVGQVRKRDVHKVPTARMGGVGMLLGFFVAMIFASRTDFLSSLFRDSRQPYAIMAGAAAICLLGVCDDIWDLDWMLKLSGQLLISVYVSLSGIQVVSLPFGSLIGASAGISMTVVSVLMVISINAVNFVDGLDGLASGIVAIGGIAFGTYSYMTSRTSPSYASVTTLIDVVLVGLCIGFLFHNWNPARLFMGDSGSMLLGYLITCASIIMTGHIDPNTVHASLYLPVFMPVLLPVLVLFLPFLDMIMAIVRRLAKGQSPMHPDRMHLHHRMLRIGHSVPGAVLILWGWAALISFGSVMTLFFKFRYVAAAVAVLAALLSFLTLHPYIVKKKEIRQNQLTESSLENGFE